MFSSDDCQTLEELSEEVKVGTISSEVRSEPKGWFRFHPIKNSKIPLLSPELSVHENSLGSYELLRWACLCLLGALCVFVVEGMWKS